MTFFHVEPGDVVTRLLGGSIKLDLLVTHVGEDLIYCGEPDVGWKFRRDTGAEVDEELEWGITIDSPTGSVLIGSSDM